MKDIPQITDSEWEVMKVVWSNPPHTSSDIIDILNQSMNWKPTTVKTLISRLVKKSVIGVDNQGKKYLYYPLLTEDECKAAESKTFLNKIYNGSVKPLLMNFIQAEDLSEEEIQELQNMLDLKSKDK